MSFKTFFVKNVLMSFFVSVTCITIGITITGMIFDPQAQFGYEAFLSPLLYGFIGSFSTLVNYSKKELSTKQVAIRNVIHLLLLEIIIMSFFYFGGALVNVSITASLALTIFIIYLTVCLVLWINDKKTAKDFNEALKKIQNNW